MIRPILQFVAGLVACALFIAVPLGVLKITQFKAMGAQAAAMVFPPTVVTATEAKKEVWGESLSAPGSLEAVQGVTIAAEVPGKVAKIAFEAGAVVQEGDLLVQLDTSSEEAQLRAAEATAALARANLARARELRSSGTNSPAELDAADAQARQADAQAENLRAIIAKKAIRAPFSGRLGLRLVNLGQILRDGAAIATLQTLDPIYVNFAMPQQRIGQLAPGTAVRVTSDAAPGAKFDGTIHAVSPEIDAATRTARVQATIANAGEKLRPGMYASIEVILPAEREVLAIPTTSVLYAPYGDTVFVIEEKPAKDGAPAQLVLRQQFVRLGNARGDFVSVLEGLKPGDRVVTTGVFKLRPGMPVAIDNALAPAMSLAPKPNNT
ncbi:MAG: efflux RND transporter periplasmic adaptor subunit [Opitutae bacterium]|nr:efflux RND transporter periplasmic adaptor subunit [Opitutae bacterium]